MTLARTLWVLCLPLCAACIAELAPEVGELAVAECEPRDSDPEIDVSFEMDVLPLLKENCSCHDPASPFPIGLNASGFSIESYGVLRRGGSMSGQELVVDGDPCNSLITQKIGEAPPFGSRMPLYGPYLDDTSRALLHDWIAEGAQDD